MKIGERVMMSQDQFQKIQKTTENVEKTLQIESDFVSVLVLEKSELNRINVLRFEKEGEGEFEETSITVERLIDIIYELLNSETILIKNNIEVRKVNDSIIGDSYYAIVRENNKLIIISLRAVDSV